MASQTLENYLKELYNRTDNKGEVNPTDIASGLGVSMPTVNSMAKKMDQEGYVVYKKYKPLVLTPKGKLEAALIIRKHRLIEMFLVEKMGLGWEQVHDVAEQIEHIKSPLFFDRMDEILGFPKYDPHGSPIPDKYGNIDHVNYRQLTECKVGEKVTLKALKDTSDEFLTYLNSKSISLGTKFEIIHIEEFDQSMTLKYAGQKNGVFSKVVCEKFLMGDS